MSSREQETGTNGIFSFRRSLLLATVLLVFTIMQSYVTHAQTKSSNRTSLEDSPEFLRQHHSRWHPYGGLHLSGDAEMYYLGPSVQAGVDFNLKPRLLLSAYIHYFYVSVDNTVLSEKGRLRTLTSAFLIQFNTGLGWYKGFYLGLGVATQRYADRFAGILSNYDLVRTTFTPAIRMGNLFPLGLYAIAFEFNGTGPYSYSDGYNGTITEIFTQVSLGVRFIF